MRNLDEHTITAEVLRSLERSPNPRLHEIMSKLIEHLHQFARDIRLSGAEWLEGIKFLTRTGQISDDVRQEMILLSDTLGLSQLVVAQNHSRPGELTEQTVFGPFHVEGAPRLPAHGANIAGGCKGVPLYVSARVLDPAGKPISGAVADVWQADAAGFYDVQDPNWQIDEARLRAIFETDEKGSFSFWSIMPTSYPIPTDGPVGEMMKATLRSPMRPAHIHFMIKKAGFDDLVTHVFVDGDEYLDSDAVFGVRGSCIGQYVSHSAGRAPDRTYVDSTFSTLDYRFSLWPAR
jgi:hydroxyquinol 1,2-dioxygenase